MKKRKRQYGYVGMSVKPEVRERLREQARRMKVNVSTVIDYLSKISLTNEIKLNEKPEEVTQ